jgi:hypothetical protein
MADTTRLLIILVLYEINIALHLILYMGLLNYSTIGGIHILNIIVNTIKAEYAVRPSKAFDCELDTMQ